MSDDYDYESRKRPSDRDRFSEHDDRYGEYSKKSKDQDGNSDEFTIFIGSLNFQAREEDVERHFESCGVIKQVKIPMGQDGRPRGFAYVSFDSAEAVERAIELDNSELLERPIKVEKSRPRGAGGDRSGGGRPERRDNRVPASAASSDTVFVANLSFDATERDIEDHFSRCGRISQVRIPTNRDTGRPRGFAYVVFESDGAVAEALKLSGSQVMGRDIRVDYASDKKGGGDRPDRGSDRFGGGRDRRDDRRDRGGDRYDDYDRRGRDDRGSRRDDYRYESRRGDDHGRGRESTRYDY